MCWHLFFIVNTLLFILSFFLTLAALCSLAGLKAWVCPDCYFYYTHICRLRYCRWWCCVWFCCCFHGLIIKLLNWLQNNALKVFNIRLKKFQKLFFLLFSSCLLTRTSIFNLLFKWIPPWWLYITERVTRWFPGNVIKLVSWCYWHIHICLCRQSQRAYEMSYQLYNREIDLKWLSKLFDLSIE